ncbi:hypothetical protein GQ457_01G002860 [Hibiscus cannabinus]
MPWLGHLMAALALVFPGACLARHLYQDCGSVFCGSLNISYPLRLKNQPPHCGDPRLELECDKNNRTTFVGRQGKFSVEQIFYENHTMRVVDAGLNMDDCNSLPLGSLYSFVGCRYPQQSTFYYYYYYHKYREPEGSIMYLVNCTKPIKSSQYIEASRCSIKSNASSYFYFLDEGNSRSDFDQSCTVEAEVPISVYNISAMSTLDIYKKLSQGIFLRWYYLEDYCSNNKLSFQQVLSYLRYAFRTYMDSFVYYPFGSKEYGYPIARTHVLSLAITGEVFAWDTLFTCACHPQMEKKTFISR